jgi:uncharacterized protein YbbC (DUF1343 family)/CubicO group peptidase (beta-lactamase class C family)
MIRRLVSLLLLAGCASLTPDPRFQPLDAAIEEAIAAHKLPGGVLWVERDGTVYHRAYGNRAVEPRVEAMTESTIFDAASITKVTATTPSIWILIERGKIGLDDPASKYIPEFRGGWRDEVTIRHLLTHSSGLRPDLDLDTDWSGYDTAVRLASEEMPRNRPGYVFRYSDINFILLGEIVRRVSGMPLDEFARRTVFEPLGMKDTRFRPSDLDRVAPTERGVPRGAVHDPTARRMGGVAGHAGLFTTARDLAVYARTLLAGGGPILKTETVKMLTSVQSPPGVAVQRAGGFDIDSGYSRPRGDFFPFGSYGHTGFTGGFLWIDPASHTFYVFLSNRVHPDGTGSVVALQRRLGTLVAKAVGAAGAPVSRRVGWVTGGADVMNGIDVLHSGGYRALQGMRIGLITNHTGIDRAGNPTIDLLRSAPGVTLAALFSPEHGIRGVLDAKVDDASDPISGLPIYSLYGSRRAPAPEQLAGLDALVFDIQDIGTRFYTYISTLGLAMEAAAAEHKKFVVLDRVNPIGGVAVEGPLPEGGSDFISYHPITIRHGMTVGELANMYRAEKHLDLDLEVVPLRGWKRAMWSDEAGLPWVNPSPNMRSLQAAALYPGIGILETAISVGRGTPSPFEIAGAPYADPEVLAREMNALGLPGVRFEQARFTPSASVFANQACGGVRMTLTERKALEPVRTGIALALTLHRLYPGDFALDKMSRLLRHAATLEAIRRNAPLDEVVRLWEGDQQAFRERRERFVNESAPPASH